MIPVLKVVLFLALGALLWFTSDFIHKYFSYSFEEPQLKIIPPDWKAPSYIQNTTSRL
jgi:hypothetical protein